MRCKLTAIVLFGFVAIASESLLLAQRGGRGGGGARGGGSNYRGGGFGGGISNEGTRGEGTRGRSPGEGSRPNTGVGPYGRPGGGDESSRRPGMPAGGSARPGTGAASPNRPGMPGTATRPGMATTSSVNRPGMNAASTSARPYGTYHTPTAALGEQGDAVRSAASAYPRYNPAMYGNYPNAWRPTNLTGNSLYANPGYGSLAGLAGLSQQAQPYDYGGNVVVQPQAVYVNGDNAGTPQQYADQAGQIATNGNAQPAPDSTWQPLGVFAMVEGDQTSSDDTFELAINAQGLLRGNYHNLKDNSVVSVAGSVDPKSQRAAWTIGGDKTPVYEAGIANLTKNEATMLLHTGDGQPRQFTLVRLEQPAN